MKQPNVCVVSGDPEFARSISEQWQLVPGLPCLTLIHGELAHEVSTDAADLIVVGGFAIEDLSNLLARVGPNKALIVLLRNQEPAHLLRVEFPKAFIVQPHSGAIATAVGVAGETLKRIEAEAEAREATEAAEKVETQAALGRLMLEMRHTMNNVLTSVLGNAELLLLDPQSLSEGQRSKIETIRSMAGRLHEMLQRFTALEKERKWMEDQGTITPSGILSGTKTRDVAPHKTGSL